MRRFLTIILVSFTFIGQCSAAPSPNKNEPKEGEEKSVDEVEQPLKGEDLQVFVDYALDWAHEVNLIVRMKEHKTISDVAQVVPFALFPTPFPRKQYEQAVNVHESAQLLRLRIASDYQFLVDVHAEMAASDDTIGRELALLHELHREGIRQPLTLILQRSDYMLNTINDDRQNGAPKYAIKEIETNIGPVGGFDRAQRLPILYRQILGKAGIKVSQDTIPDSNSEDNVAEGLYRAWEAFGNPNAIVVFVVYKPRNTYAFGARHTENALIRRSGGTLKVVWLSIGECADKFKLAEDYTLMLEDNVVAVVYDRTEPASYTTYYGDKGWEGRRIFERSTAIKAPSVLTLLACTKKVQQVLALPGKVERFFPEPEDTPKVDAIRATYAGLWGLNSNDQSTTDRINDAIEHPDRYVLKPQGDGGGHNFFDQALADRLRAFTPEDRTRHILMERLRPMVAKNYMVMPLKDTHFGDVNSELGVFGCLLGNVKTGQVLYNAQRGQYMRTKMAERAEGGIGQGTAVVDYPYLY